MLASLSAVTLAPSVLLKRGSFAFDSLQRERERLEAPASRVSAIFDGLRLPADDSPHG